MLPGEEEGMGQQGVSGSELVEGGVGWGWGGGRGKRGKEKGGASVRKGKGHAAGRPQGGLDAHQGPGHLGQAQVGLDEEAGFESVGVHQGPSPGGGMERGGLRMIRDPLEPARIVEGVEDLDVGIRA